MVNKLSLFLPFLLALAFNITAAEEEEFKEGPRAVLLNYTEPLYEPTAVQDDNGPVAILPFPYKPAPCGITHQRCPSNSQWMFGNPCMQMCDLTTARCDPNYIGCACICDEGYCMNDELQCVRKCDREKCSCDSKVIQILIPNCQCCT